MSFLGNATLMEGARFNLLALAGLTLTDSEVDLLWDTTSAMELLGQCFHAELVEVEEFDDAPGMSDTLYAVYSDDKAALAKELRDLVSEAIGQGKVQD